MSSITALLQAAEYIERHERGMRKNWQDLPDELILKILSYSEVKELISCGQVSKRIRRISHDGTLWVMAILENKVVKTELLELILSKGCKILNISNSTIIGRLSSNMKSQLKILKLSQPEWGYPAKTLLGLHVDRGLCINRMDPLYYEENIDVLEQLLFSFCSLQQLEMQGFLITSKMVDSICKNGKTLQLLNLNQSYVYESDYPYSPCYRSDRSVVQIVVQILYLMVTCNQLSNAVKN